MVPNEPGWGPISDLFMLLREDIRYNHADSLWLTESSGLFSHNSSYLLIAHVIPRRKSCLKIDMDTV